MMSFYELINTFIIHADPSEVDVEARQLAEGEPRLLDVTRGRAVLLSSPPHDHTEGGLEANDGGGDGSGPSVAYEGGYDNQNDSHSRRVPSWRIAISKKRKQKVKPSMGAPSLPPKKLRADHGLLNQRTTFGKSRATVN